MKNYFDFNNNEDNMMFDDVEEVLIPAEGRSNKRKSTEEGSLYNSLEENIKRCKITSTPGELRLQTDLKEASKLRGVTLELVEPSSVTVLFNDQETLGIS